jgi:hypothetical protein
MLYYISESRVIESYISSSEAWLRGQGIERVHGPGCFCPVHISKLSPCMPVGAKDPNMMHSRGGLENVSSDVHTTKTRIYTKTRSDQIKISEEMATLHCASNIKSDDNDTSHLLFGMTITRSTWNPGFTRRRMWKYTAQKTVHLLHCTVH